MSSRSIETAHGIHIEQKAIDGYVNPFKYAAKVHSNPQDNRNQVLALGRKILTLPTREFLYEGTEEALTEFLGRGDSVSIWTDEYANRVYSSGLLKQKKNGIVTPDIAEDKLPLLPALYALANESGAEAVIVVDDGLDELRYAAEVAREVCSLPVQFVLRAHEETDPFPWGFPARYLPLRVIYHTGEMVAVRESVVGSRGRTKLITDFNSTLLHTASYEETHLLFASFSLNGNMVSRE